jgi:hypothetical protein
MSGLDRKTPIPTEITLHTKSRVLELKFDDGSQLQLPAEFLRVYSPSAEVRGHGPGQETLQTGKRNVDITELEAVGNYAVSRPFPTATTPASTPGICSTRSASTTSRCGPTTSGRLESAGASRDIGSTTLPPKSGGCGQPLSTMSDKPISVSRR